jgi:uncharacterized protein (DUF849 family)
MHVAMSMWELITNGTLLKHAVASLFRVTFGFYLAVLLGFDTVRIGMEDAVYMYPHREEKIDRPADVVRKVANIARELGREIATPEEARQIMGLDARLAL